MLSRSITLPTQWRFLRPHFLLPDNRADPAEIPAGVEAGILFQDTNPWALIFAILVTWVSEGQLHCRQPVQLLVTPDAPFCPAKR